VGFEKEKEPYGGGQNKNGYKAVNAPKRSNETGDSRVKVNWGGWQVELGRREGK